MGGFNYVVHPSKYVCSPGDGSKDWHLRRLQSKHDYYLA